MRRVTPSQFRNLFKPPGVEKPGDRENFLSRMFGIFSENIVCLWSKSAGAPYENLGRPTVRFDDEATKSTLDFTLRHKESNKTLRGRDEVLEAWTEPFVDGGVK